MNALTGAVARAIPPPPDWDSVADKIGQSTINHLSDYVGSVPDAPSQQEINQATSVPLPKPDISTPEQDTLTPKVPEDFEKGPIKFDIASTPAVETKDESKPFVLSDPMANIKTDPPGKGPLPGDSSNSMGDIEKPKKFENEDPPVPKKIIFEIPKPAPPTTPPKTEAPEPGKIIFEIPKPKSQTIETPIPKATEPIPK
jgi:hypothetical protein